MLLRNISREANQSDDAELLDMIVTDVSRLRRCGQLLLAGFDGTEVVRTRSYGTRWYTHALSPEQARANIDYGYEGINVFEYAVETRNLPTIGVFAAKKMKAIYRDQVLIERYLREFRKEPPDYDFYAVHGSSLDEAAIALYYFRTADNPISHR